MSENKITHEEKLFASMILFLYKNNVLSEKTYRSISLLYAVLIKLDEFDLKRIKSKEHIQHVMNSSSNWWCIYRMLLNQQKRSTKSKKTTNKFLRKKSRLRNVSF